MHVNRLSGEGSPYLLQHAHNPVDWYPWCDEAWEKARNENKLVLISVGYSACHWCHVMEHESFENEATARIMNEHFVCIKVDREERPDVDQVYMSAVQLMTGNGGWPLNCFALPDGRPIYGGTYFPNVTWNDLLLKLSSFYKEDPERAMQYATELTDGIRKMDSVPMNLSEPIFKPETVHASVLAWTKRFDTLEGGANRAPKFPLPNNYEFLLQYGVLTGNKSILDQVKLTLDKMSYGGIYDQIGGGFCRYAVDSIWKVPHFEKMLYDNAQLVSLYSKAYRWSGDLHYKDILTDTLSFVKRELTSSEGLFYSALDADSEGVEGKYYTWTLEELEGIEFPAYKNINVRKLILETFNLNQKGYWEHGRYIPLRDKSDEQIALAAGIPRDEFRSILHSAKSILLQKREQRIRPGLDHKILLSWNSLMISGYCDAYEATGDAAMLTTAIHAVSAIEKNLRRKDGRLIHSRTMNKPVPEEAPVFLEDLAFYAAALTDLYRCTFDERYLAQAKTIADEAIDRFFDPDTSLFWFTPSDAPALVTRKIDVNDNVIPCANSALAKVFFLLGRYLGMQEFSELSDRMLHAPLEQFERYGAGYSNWLQLLLWRTFPFREIVITGSDALSNRTKLSSHYLPNALIAGDHVGTCELPLCRHRFRAGEELVYICENNTCGLPITDLGTAIASLLSRGGV